MTMIMTGGDVSGIVIQAQVIVAVQLGTSLRAAVRVMQDTAEATDTTLEDVAEEVLCGRVRFDGL
jgi:hypothetical protein